MKTMKKTVLDPDLAKVGAALRRAAKQARRTATLTDTPLVVYQQGQVIRKKMGRGKDQ
jgi:hypothetical protein